MRFRLLPSTAALALAALCVMGAGAYPTANPAGTALDDATQAAPSVTLGCEQTVAGTPASVPCGNATNPLTVTLPALPAGTNNIGTVAGASTHTTPTVGSVTLTTAGVVVLTTAQVQAANGIYAQVQGTGYGCAIYSATLTSTPSANAATATCSNGGILINAGVVFAGGIGALPNVQMKAASATGATLQINYSLN